MPSKRIRSNHELICANTMNGTIAILNSQVVRFFITLAKVYKTEISCYVTSKVCEVGNALKQGWQIWKVKILHCFFKSSLHPLYLCMLTVLTFFLLLFLLISAIYLNIIRRTQVTRNGWHNPIKILLALVYSFNISGFIIAGYYC